MSNKLDQFFQRVATAPKEEERVKVEYNIMNNANINRDLFKRTLHNIANMDNSNLKAFIQANIDQIINDIINNDADYVGIFQDYRFLDIFTEVISSNAITYNTILGCNKLAYDYITLSEDHIDNTVKNKLINLSNIVNRTTIKRLMDLGLSTIDACNIAICRYSSGNEKINTERLNFMLCKMNSNIVTLQNIIYIYEILYDSISSLFSGIMFETYTEEEEDDFGYDFMNNYSNISIAILTIVNNLPSDKIDILLRGYVEEWKTNKCPQTRFSFRSISNDYNKINNVVEGLIASDIYIP